MDQTAGVTFTFLFYLIAVLLIGYYGYRQTKNNTDYYLGGRNLSSGVAALSACASDMSAWLLLGLPGYAYVSGLEKTYRNYGDFRIPLTRTRVIRATEADSFAEQRTSERGNGLMNDPG